MKWTHVYQMIKQYYLGLGFENQIKYMINAAPKGMPWKIYESDSRVKISAVFFMYVESFNIIR